MEGPSSAKTLIRSCFVPSRQFCDYYKHYSSAELKYMPLNTVIYGPINHGDMIYEEPPPESDEVG